MVTRELYEHFPKQRALSQDLMNEVKEVITLKAISKLLRQKIEASSCKTFTLKDIANLHQYSKVSFSGSEIKNITEFLKLRQESVVEILVDQDKNFKGISFQDLKLQRVYEKFPGILLVNATYKLLELRMPIYLLIAIDRNGKSEIVAIFILADESKLTVTEVVKVFQKHNSCWTDTKVVMSDKDFSERDAFASCFPGAVLLICLYHTYVF